MDTYKRLFKYTPEKIGCAYGSIVLSAVATFLQMAPYWFFWKFLNELIVNKNPENSKHYATVIIVLMLAQGVVYFLALWASHLLGFRLESNLRKQGISHLMKASFAFFDNNPSGKIRKIIDDNAAETHMIVAHLIPDTIGAIFTPILMMIIMFFVDVKLGFLLLAITVIGGVMIAGMVGNRDFMKNYMASLEKLNAETVEYVRGMQVVKIFRGTVQSFKAFYDAIMSYSEYALNYSISCRTAYVSFQVVFNIFITFAIVIFIPSLSVAVLRGEEVSYILAKTVFFSCFAGMMFGCLMKVMYVGMYQFQALQVVDKLENLFDEMKKDGLTYGTQEKFEHCDIEFQNVSFKYDEDYVLKDVNFHLNEGKTYALVGSSGGGKSTIAKLISGFYKIEEGKILIGGKDISQYSQEALMQHVAFVFQNAKLFKKTIFENVKIGRENATYEEVMDALKEARCDDILNKFKERENTLIGSKGVHLSGGEMQRIAIARAILKDADIVILDEASAAADPENEYEIQQAFSNLMKNKTVIMIAHRLSSIRNVDEILVIDGGNVVERGTDVSLLASGGKYAQLQKLFAKANDWRIYDC